MASALALRKTMAGHVPAIRTAAVTFALVCSVLSVPAVAQADAASGDQLRYLHRSLVIAEDDLGAAMREKDFSRAKSANDTLFNLSSSAKKREIPANACSEALESLEGVAVAVGFAVHPVATGDVALMNKEDLRFSVQMRPAPEVLQKWYADHSATYRNKMAACEQEAAAGPSPRSLPTQLMQK